MEVELKKLSRQISHSSAFFPMSTAVGDADIKQIIDAANDVKSTSQPSQAN